MLVVHWVHARPEFGSSLVKAHLGAMVCNLIIDGGHYAGRSFDGVESLDQDYCGWVLCSDCLIQQVHLKTSLSTLERAMEGI